MTAGPFDVGALIARLQAQVAGFKFVAGAAELAMALQGGGAPQTPCAYVLLATETAPASYGSSEAHVQTVQVTVNVVIAVRNYRVSELGQQSKDDVNSMIAAVRAALLGWAPDTNSSGLDLAGGKLERYDNATVWWNEAYRFSYFIRVIPQ